MINEEVTQAQLKDLEKFADRLLNKFDVNVEFTKHFAERMNDSRNNPAIKISELQAFFKKVAKAKAKNIKSHPNSEVVLKDLQKDLNLPVVIRLDKQGDIEVTHKTIMRKKDFKTPDQVVQYEEVDLQEVSKKVDKMLKSHGYLRAGGRTGPKVHQLTFYKHPHDWSGHSIHVDNSSKTTIVVHGKDGDKKTEMSHGQLNKHLTNRNTFNEEKSFDDIFETFLEEQNKNLKALQEKAEKSDIDFEILETVYNRGLESFKTANRPHLSESQWAWARVNSFIAGGHARERDADLLEAEDSDIGNRAGSQPKKYFSGLKKSTKVARDRHFKRGAKMDDDNPSAYKMAPGDKDAETKPSKHTKRFKQMFGEEIKNKQLMHHGKTTKNFEMCPSALKAFDKNQKDGMGDNSGFHDAVVAVDKYLGFEKSTLKKDKATTADLQKMQELVADAKTKIEKANLKGHDYHQIHIDAVKNHMKDMNEVFEEFVNLEESQIEALKKKAEKSGVSYSILKKVYDRGIAAWRTGHRPGTTPQQWALARVNSFLTGGTTQKTTDKDLWSKAKSQKESTYSPMELAILEGGQARLMDADLVESRRTFKEWTLENPEGKWHSTQNKRVIPLKQKGGMYHPADIKDTEMLRAVTGKHVLSSADLKYAHGAAHRQGYKLNVDS